MARLKFGSIVTSGSGSLGGHTIQNSKGGMQLRNKPINKKQPSASQALIRGYNTALQQGWRNLSDAQRLEWNGYAATHGIFNKNGDQHPLSGHSLYLKYNFGYIYDNLDLIVSPYLYKSVRLGSELVSNPNFDTTTNWVLHDWSISNGHLISGTYNTLYQFMSNGVVNGHNYQLKAYVNKFASGSFVFFIGSTPYVQPGPITSQNYYVFNFNLTCPSGLYMGVYVAAAFVGELDYISLKEIL